MEIFTILLFSAALIGCVAAQISVLYALVAGYLIFCAYALFKKHTAAQIASMLNGGGVRSMLNVAAIVCLSSSYAGIFAGTGLLDSLKARVAALGGRTSAFFVVFCVSVAAAIIACNQTLTIMLTHQVCGSVEPDAQQFAVDLGDTAVVLAPLVPWSIAGAVPLASIGAPTVCLAAACYLYALPLWQLLVRSISAKKQAAHVLEK